VKQKEVTNLKYNTPLLAAANFKQKWRQRDLEANTHYQNHTTDCNGDAHTTALGYVPEIPFLSSLLK
jgi:hypothetical protein